MRAEEREEKEEKEEEIERGTESDGERHRGRRLFKEIEERWEKKKKKNH